MLVSLFGISVGGFVLAVALEGSGRFGGQCDVKVERVTTSHSGVSLILQMVTIILGE